MTSAVSGRPRVLVTGPLLDPAPALLAEGCQVVGLQGRPLSEAATGCAGIVAHHNDRVDEALLATPGLRVLAAVAVGVNNVDLGAATRHGVVVTNTSGVLEEAVADLTFGLLLATARRIGEAERAVRSGSWPGWALDQYLGRDLTGATLGLIGFGGIGRAVARRAGGFGMRVVYTAAHRHPAEEEEAGATFRSLDDLLRESDVVSLHVPLTPETRHLIGAPQLARMKPDAILLNTSRGPVVDEAAVAAALAAGRLWAVGLDVYEDEPRPHPGLLASERAVLTPHIGSATAGARSAMCVTAVRNVLAVLAGERPPNPVNPEVLP